MKVKNIILAFVLILATQVSSAQKKTLDTDRIAILPYVSDQIEYLPIIAKNNLQSKLAQIVSQNGYGSSVGFTNRFILTPNISVINKYIVPGAPTKVSLELEVALFVGDGVTGVKYESTFINVKGVGLNETKAYISALKGIRPKNKNIIQLLEVAKQKILKLYEDCDFTLKDIDNLISMQKYDEALLIATSVPRVSRKCYDLAFKKVKPIFKMKIDNDCKVLLSKAEAAWNIGQNLESAQAAGAYLTQINPASDCYGNVKTFYNKISAKVNKNEKRAWDFVLKQQENLNDYKNNELDAYRKINIERAKNQPREIYNIKGWW